MATTKEKKNMAKQVWLTTDGSTFDNEAAADKHELEYNVRNALAKCMSRDYERCINAIMSTPALNISYIHPDSPTDKVAKETGDNNE